MKICFVNQLESFKCLLGSVSIESTQSKNDHDINFNSINILKEASDIKR